MDTIETLRVRHIVRAQQFQRPFLQQLCSLARKMEILADSHHTFPTMHGKVLATLFYQPSTRTRLSFESAMVRLGGRVISTENAREFSSAIKGESLEDTIRIVGGYADAIVLRHYEDDAAEHAATVSEVPIINAGSGTGQHPTQALLDYYTILREQGRLPNDITFVGDLKNGRTVRSLAYLLGHAGEWMHMRFVSPPELRIGEDIKESLAKHGIRFTESESLQGALPDTDVVYMTRVQKEAFSDPAEYERLKDCCRLDVAMAEKMLRPNAIIMHPLPRNDEIATEVDALPQAAYFRQAKYGLYVRMALLKMLLDH